MRDVADDRDVQPVEPAERLAHRVEVEQRLRRMLVLAVAGVHDTRIGVVRDELGGADLRVADDDHVGVVGRQRQRRVLQRLALVDRRAGGLHVSVSAESRFAASSNDDDVRVDDS